MRYLACIFVILVPAAWADQPPDWGAFVAHSDNDDFTAVVSRSNAASDPWNDHWHIAVYEGYWPEGPPPEVTARWSQSYQHRGYSGGYLSDTGDVFVYLSFWYFEDGPVLDVYGQNCRMVMNGSEFNLSGELKRSVSHELWLDNIDDFRIVTEDGHGEIYVPTVDGEKLVEVDC